MSHKYSFTVSRNQFIAICSVLILFVTGTAFGLSVGNSPNTGYLLCSNTKTHTVIYPAKLSCPSGYINLQLGAQGQHGQDGLNGQPGAPGPQGASAVSGPNYLITAQPQNIVASVQNKILVTLVKKSGIQPGWYSVDASVDGIFANTTQQVVLCDVNVNGQAAHTSIPSKEAAGTWTDYDVPVNGMLQIGSVSDTVNFECHFTGNSQVLISQLALTSISAPTQMVSD